MCESNQIKNPSLPWGQKEVTGRFRVVSGLHQVELGFRDELHLSHLLERYSFLAYFEAKPPDPQGPRHCLIR